MHVISRIPIRIYHSMAGGPVGGPLRAIGRYADRMKKTSRIWRLSEGPSQRVSLDLLERNLLLTDRTTGLLFFEEVFSELSLTI